MKPIIHPIIFIAFYLFTALEIFAESNWNDYMQMDIGNRWSTKFETKDWKGNVTTRNNNYEFTAIIEYDGRQCCRLNNSYYYFMEGSKLFISSNEFKIVYAFRGYSPGPEIKFETKLIQIGDFEQEGIKQYYDSTFTDLLVYQDAYFNGKMSVSGEKTDTIWTIKGQVVDAVIFNMYCTIDGDINYLDMDTSIVYVMKGRLIQGKNVGLLLEGWEFPEIKHIYHDNELGYRYYTDSTYDYSLLTGVDENIANSNTKIKIAPNPFSDFFDVNYEITMPGDVTFLLYDVLSNETAVLFEEYKEAGKHNFMWNVGNTHACSLPAGVYFLRMETDNSILCKKVIKY